MIIVEARIEETYSSIGAIQTQIRSQFKVAMLQQSRSVRSMKVEDFYYNNIDNANNLDLTVECAKVAVSVSNDVNNEVKTTVKGTWIFILDKLNMYATLHQACAKGGGGTCPPRFWQIRRRRRQAAARRITPHYCVPPQIFRPWHMPEHAALLSISTIEYLLKLEIPQPLLAYCH